VETSTASTVEPTTATAASVEAAASTVATATSLSPAWDSQQSHAQSRNCELPTHANIVLLFALGKSRLFLGCECNRLGVG
jgi:hypothetical protein